MTRRDRHRTTKVTLALALAGALLSCAAEPGLDEPGQEPLGTVEEALPGEPVSAQLQHEISQVLWGCYAAGADLVGAGHVEAARATLRRCYAEDMEFEAIMPPAYAFLNFTTTGGADGFVEGARQLYQTLGITRTQHLVTNIVVKKTGPNTAVVTSSGFAVHAYADEHSFTGTIKFVDDFRRVNGVWKMTHRIMTATSVTESAAWVPFP